MSASTEENINLVERSDSELESILRVTIEENLPYLSNGKWSDKDWLEGEPGEEELSDQAAGTFYSIPSSPKAETSTAEGRWEFIMNKLINIENNTTSLRMDFSSLSDKVESQSTQLLQVKSSVADLSDEVGLQSTQLLQVKASLASHETKIALIDKKQQSDMAEFDHQLGHKFRTMETSFKMENERFKQVLLSETKKQIKDEMLQEQCSQRKLNLIFVGLAENGNKTDLEIVKTFLSKKMNISDVDVISAYRLGKSPGSKPRPILARFLHVGHRNRVWFSKAAIKQDDAKVWLQEDLPRVVKNSYRALFKVLKKAKSMGDRFPGTQILGQSIIVDGKSYKVEDLESLPDVLRPSHMAMQQSDNTLVFFGRASPLSNHHFSPFIIEDIPFQCMEQYLAWRRAKLADKQDLIDKALLKADPLVYKSILTDLHSVKAEEWSEDLPDTALVGIRAKFRQNPPPLAHFLANTYPKKLGEASPNKRWGVGFTLIHPDVLNSEKWIPNGNLLGETLMVVREELISEKNA